MSVQFQIHGDVAVALIDSPPVNAINAAIRAGLIEAVARVETSDAKALVVACAGRTFLSGADLGELEHGIPEPGYAKMLAALEGCSKPVVAALFGTALGGGVETAIACHYRVASPDAKLGMPEITLGILPGAGGTQRLPRLVGPVEALSMMVSGAPVPAARALELGLIDKIIEGDLLVGAIDYAATLSAPRRTGDMPVNAEGFDQAAIDSVLAKNARGLKGRTTQNLLVETVTAALVKPLAEGLALEDRLSRESLKSPEGRALIHAFFAERKCGRIPGLPDAVKPATIARAAVIGAGTMGGGIAMALADSGVPVILIEANEQNLQRGLGKIRDNYQVSVQRGRFTQDVVDQRIALITGALDLKAAAEVDLVIEAVFEDMDLKKSILSRLDAIIPAHAVLASNTSSLSLTELASVTSNPARVVGLHFFSPANVMRLLEIVRGAETSDQTLVTALDVAKKLRKVGVVVGDGFGFVGNRMMLDGYFREAEQMLLEGVTPERIDAVAEKFGFAMGPNRVNDMAGVDVGTKVRIELFKREARVQPYNAVSDEVLTPAGRLGQKTGKGVYRYEPGSRDAIPDPELSPMLAALARKYGVAQREISDEEIQDRLVLPLINIGAQILDEGLAYRASDIDVIWTNGYGFPRWRGGPMFYADELGLETVVKKISQYHDRFGHYWTPSPLLVRLAQANGGFRAFDADLKDRG